MSSCRPGRVAAMLLVAALAQLAVPTPQAVAGGCPDADSLPGQASPAQLGRATLCLVNRERRREGLRPLRANRRLALAARRHAADMVRYSYFSHSSRTGAGVAARVARAGYLRRAPWWLVGENLAWGAGTAATPRYAVRSWMDSPPHRMNILNGRFRDLGAGVVERLPNRLQADVAATYVHNFGVKR